MATYLSRLFIFFLLMTALTSQGMAASSMALGYTPKYKPGFSHFDYVNPNAPKGGTLVLSALGSFDGFNPFILRVLPAFGVTDLVFESLMDQSWDEPYSLYAHIAEDIKLAPDRLSVTFRLNPKAQFSDGSPITADDVKFSFDTLKSKQAHPQFRIYWADIKRAVVVDPHTIRFEFAKVNPELHLIAAQIPIFSRRWLGNKPFDKVATELPIGSGPYVVGSYQLGREVTYVRNPHYWAQDLNTRRGMYNFDRIVVKYYKDDTVQLEGFKAGEFDFIYVYNSKQWARGFVGPAFDDGRIKKASFKHFNDAGMQGFIFNMRRDLFKDKRVREAINLAFDFEWSNSHLFYNQYTRCNSYFSNSELASSGLPEGAERALLEPFRAQLPPSVFTHVWTPPSTAPPNSLRNNLRQAQALLTEAGWKLKDGVLQDAQGHRLEFEVLLAQKAFERIMAPFARNLAELGVIVHYRTVDLALYQRRTDTFDFDMIVESFGQSQSPGNELFGLWGSSAADQEGSNNTIGIKDPVVDALIAKVVYAPDRKHLVTAVHALDRVLLNSEYIVPNWYIAVHRVAYWNTLAFPEKLPLYYTPDAWMMHTWWKK